MKYFAESVDYPSFSEDILPYATMYCYVASSFLNGLVNYSKPIKAFVLGRYTRWDEVVDHELSIQDPPGSFKWTKKTFATKDDLYGQLIIKDQGFHVKLDNDFQDDVLMLSVDDDGVYWFFWYDQDCSDCCIGRFVTSDPVDSVVDEFSRYVHGLSVNEYGEREIPVHYFSGWLSG